MPQKLSLSYHAKMKRMREIPKMSEEMITAFYKYQALSFIKEFHDGIKDKSMGLEKLADGTIVRKSRESFKRPEAPLYGAGDEKQPYSYMNMMRIKNVAMGSKRGFIVFPSTHKHWKSKLTLAALFIVHEGGTIIKGKGGAFIRIPARPAARIAFTRSLNTRKKMEPAKAVKRAIVDHINNATKISEDMIVRRKNEGLRKFFVKE